MSGAMTIGLKEIRDHLRDRRSLRAGALFALMGPAVIFLVSQSAAAERGGSSLLLSMMSVFALVSAFTGGIYIALDSTAGERERGSLVPLLLNPVPRRDIIIGKWIGVSAFALAGLVLTLGAFTVVFSWSGIEPSRQLAGVLLLWVSCGLVPLTLFGAALDLFVGATSSNVKDAHARLSMVTFAPMIVGMFLVFFPDWIGRWWFAIPVIGQQALIGAALRGEAVSVLHAGVLGILTIAAAAVSLLGAGRLMSRDEFVAG